MPLQPIIKTNDLTIKTEILDDDYIIGVDITEPDETKATFKAEAKNVRGNTVKSFNILSDMESTEGVYDGQGALLNGSLVIGDNGGGSYFWNATSTATAYKGWVIKVTGVTVGRWIKIPNGDIDFRAFTGDNKGTIDASTALQTALDYIYSLTNGRNTLNFNGGKYIINSGTYIIDTSKIRINGEGAELDFRGHAGDQTEFFTVTNTDPDLFKTFTNPLSAFENIAIRGRTREIADGFNRGIKIESTAGETVAPASLVFRNVTIYDCEQPVEHLQSSYNITYIGCNITRNANGPKFTETPDMFERCVFISCTISNNLGSGLDVAAANGVVYLIGCSLDYNTRTVTITSGGIELRGCHVESTLATVPHFTVSGNATFHAEGGWWQFPRSTDPLPTALEEFDASGSFNGNITIKDVKFSSFGNDIPFTLNPEKVYVINPKPDATSLISLTRFNRHFTTPSRYFEAGALDKDMWLITSSTGLSTDRYTNPGLVMSIVNDAGEALGGSSYYLEANKIFGAGSDSNIFIAVPLGNKRRAAGKIQLKSMSGSTVSVSVTMLYATLSTSLGDSNDIKKIPYEIITSRNIGSIAQNLSSNYQSYNFNMRERALDSDTHALMQINMFLVPTGQVAIGEWYISLV